MDRPLFSKQKMPMLVTSLSDATPDELICTIRNALLDGSQGFMLHLERMDEQYRNLEDLKRVFNYVCDVPIFTLNYRSDNEKSDEQLVEEQLIAIEAGASMIDVMGDLYDPSHHELTFHMAAVEKQRNLINKVHKMGAEVLLSSHVWEFMTEEEVIKHAKELESRGADFVKIAMCVHSEDELLQAIRTTVVTKRELRVPFLHICMRQYGKLHRAIGPMLGSCFALCVQSYTPNGHKEKVLLKAEKAVFDNLDWKIARNPLT